MSMRMVRGASGDASVARAENARAPRIPDFGRRIRELFRPHRAKLTVTVALVLVTAGLTVLPPLLTEQAFDEGLFPGGGPNLARLAEIVGAMVLVWVVSQVLGVVQTYFTATVGNGVTASLRERLFTRLQQMELGFFTRTRTGVIQSRLANDVGGVANVLSNTVSSVVGNTVTVIDAERNSVRARVQVGSQPYGIAFGADGRVYVSNSGSYEQPGKTVSVLDPVTDAVVGSIPTGGAPYQLAASPDRRRIYVPNYGGTELSNSLTVIDAASGATSSLLAGDYSPVDVAADPDGHRIYVATVGTKAVPGTLQVVDVDARTVRPLLTSGSLESPRDVALTPDGRTLVVNELGTEGKPARTVAIVDTATGTISRRITLGSTALDVSITPDGRQAWVTTGSPAALWRIPLP